MSHESCCKISDSRGVILRAHFDGGDLTAASVRVASCFHGNLLLAEQHSRPAPVPIKQRSRGAAVTRRSRGGAAGTGRGGRIMH